MVPRRRHAVPAALVALAALGGTALVPPLLSPPTARADTTSSPGLTPGKDLSGVGIRGGTPAAAAFGAWRGRPVEAIVTYISTDTWAKIVDVTGEALTRYWVGSNAHMVWSVPLIPSDHSSSLEAAANGSYDNNYAKVAQGLIAGGDGNATIRLGWEMTGNWFAWSGVNDPAAFAGAFRHAVTAMRSVPGANFTFDFNIAMDSADPRPMYPGDDYVDLIGADNYDDSWGWSYPASDHVKVWNQFLTEPYGLNWLASFAAAHGKRLSMPEWGVAYKCDGHGGGDDPYFIDQVHGWLAAHDVAYEAYFESDDYDCSRFMLTSGLFPNAAEEYRKMFGTGGAAPVPPTSPPTPAPVSGTGLKVSRSHDRSGAVALAGATVGKAAYVFFATGKQVASVKFLVDGRTRRTEHTPAYDLNGTGIHGEAYPAHLPMGQHTITAVVRSWSGVVTSTSATFKVSY